MSDGDTDARLPFDDVHIRAAIRRIVRDIEDEHYDKHYGGKMPESLKQRLQAGVQLNFAANEVHDAQAFLESFSSEFIVDWISNAIILDLFVAEHRKQFEEFVKLRRQLLIEEL